MARKMEGGGGAGGAALPEVVVALVGKYSAQADSRLNLVPPQPQHSPYPSPQPYPQPSPYPYP